MSRSPRQAWGGSLACPCELCLGQVRGAPAPRPWPAGLPSTRPGRAGDPVGRLPLSGHGRGPHTYRPALGPALSPTLPPGWTRGGGHSAVQGHGRWWRNGRPPWDVDPAPRAPAGRSGARPAVGVKGHDPPSTPSSSAPAGTLAVGVGGGTGKLDFLNGIKKTASRSWALGLSAWSPVCHRWGLGRGAQHTDAGPSAARASGRPHLAAGPSGRGRAPLPELQWLHRPRGSWVGDEEPGTVPGTQGALPTRPGQGSAGQADVIGLRQGRGHSGWGAQAPRPGGHGRVNHGSESGGCTTTNTVPAQVPPEGAPPHPRDQGTLPRPGTVRGGRRSGPPRTRQQGICG